MAWLPFLLALLLTLPAASVADPVDLEALEAEVAARINAYRREAGMPEFASNAELTAVARRHSQRMASGAIDLGHDGMQGRAQELVASVGISKYAENVSRHAREKGFAEVAVTRWLASPVHRKNIDGPFTAAGVGAARSADGVVYFTQVFVVLR